MSKAVGNKAQQKRVATAAVAKQRRQKVFAGVGLAVLAVLMFIQGPKLLDALGGSGGAKLVVLPVSENATPPETDEDASRALRFLKGTGADPFSSRSLADNDPQAGSVSGPGGTHDPFVNSAAPNPVTQASASVAEPVATPVPGKIIVGTPTKGAIAQRGWIVVLASVQSRVGRAYADRFASRVKRYGVDVDVLNSSTNQPLRAGYFVVYTGPFATLEAVQRSADHVHALGYRTAYVREILRY